MRLLVCVWLMGCAAEPPPAPPDVLGHVCGGVTLRFPPDMLIVLDRSCSMHGEIDGQSKWAIASTAVQTMLAAHRGAFRFGLETFPDVVRPRCAQAGAEVPPGYATEDEIASLLEESSNDRAARLFPNGPCVTNTYVAVAQASAIMTADGRRGGYVVLVTDGRPHGCDSAEDGSDVEAALAELAAAGVPTFVVGFAAKSDQEQLERQARAGGVPNDDPTLDHYRAEDLDSLLVALDAVVERADRCEVDLAEAPPPGGITVTLDGEAVESYELTGSHLRLTGDACARLRSSAAAELSIDYACPEP